jgi:hypothetical protein
VIGAASGVRLTAAAPGTSLTSFSSNIFDVVAGPPSHLGFKQQPPTVVNVNSTFGGIQVQAQDSVGNVMTDYTPDINISLNEPPGNVSGTTTVTPASGIAAFDNVSVNAAGTFHLSASADALIDAISNSFTVAYPGTALLTQRTSDPWDMTVVGGSTLVWGESGFLAKMSTGGGGVTELANTSGASVFAVKSDGTDVYFLVFEGGNSASLRKVPLAGGTMTTLVTGITSPHDALEVTGGFVYFVSGTQLRRVATTQSPSVAVASTALLYTISVDINGRNRSFTLNSAGTELLFNTTSGLSRGAVAGGSPTLINADQALSVTVSGSTVYYMTVSAFKSAPATGGAGTTIGTPFTNAAQLASDGTNLYAAYSLGIGRIPIAGGSTTFITTHDIWGMGFVGSTVFWARFAGFDATNMTEIYSAPK